MKNEPEQIKRTISRGVKVDQKKDNFVQAGEKRDAMKEALNAQDEMMQQVASQSEAQTDEPPSFIKPPSKELIEIVLPNGLKVTMGPPPEAIQYRLARIYKKDLQDDLSVTYAKAQLYIRSINGVRENLPNSRIELELQANKLETDGLEFLAAKYLEHFVGVDLDALKKNMRGI